MEETKMLEENKNRQALLEKLMGLRYPAVALKMIREAGEVPDGAWQPFRDQGKHIALCQAFAYARRQGKTVYMEKGIIGAGTPSSPTAISTRSWARRASGLSPELTTPPPKAAKPSWRASPASLRENTGAFWFPPWTRRISNRT
jgi:Uncharacterised ArCR, COG2043.